MYHFGRMFKKYLKSANGALLRKIGVLLAYTVKAKSVFTTHPRVVREAT